MARSTTGNDRGLKSYLIGFVLAVDPDGDPVRAGRGEPAAAAARTLIIIGVAAVLQILVHLRFFLHLDFTTTPRENLLAIVFTAVLIFLMVGGSFWIMIDLHHRMAM